MSRGIVAVLVLSAVLKISLALVFADLPPRYDEEEFLGFARSIAAGGEPVLWRAPGYQVFLATGLRLGDGSAGGARVLQALLSVVTTWVVWVIGRRLFTSRIALAAAGFAAFYPPLVAFSHLLWAETLYIAIVMVAFERLLAARSEGGWRAAAFAGAALGTACLVRSSGLVLLVASFAWVLAAGGSRGVRWAASLACAAALVIAPWSISATAKAGRFVLIDTNSGFNLWSGNNPYIPKDLQGIWAVGLPRANGVEEALGARVLAHGVAPSVDAVVPEAAWRMRFAAELEAAGIHDLATPDADEWLRDEASRRIGADPLGFIRRIPRRVASFWAPDVFLGRHLARDWYGETPTPLVAALFAATLLAALVPLVLGAAALVSLESSPFRSLCALWIGAALLVHATTFGVSRMHEPFVPLLALAAAAWFLRERRAPPRPLGVAVGAASLIAWIVAAPVALGLYLSPGPRHVELARVLGAARHLPVEGTRWAAWMLAEVELAVGEDDRADRILSERKHAGEPWSLYLRSLAAKDPDAARRFAEEAAARDPDFEAAGRLRDALRAGGPR